jgi:hypothetical protein
MFFSIAIIVGYFWNCFRNFITKGRASKNGCTVSYKKIRTAIFLFWATYPYIGKLCLAFLHKIKKKLILFLENKKCYLASFVPDLKKTLGHSHSMVFNLFFFCRGTSPIMMKKILCWKSWLYIILWKFKFFWISGWACCSKFPVFCGSAMRNFY